MQLAIIAGSLLVAGAAWLLTGTWHKSKKSKAYKKAVKAAKKAHRPPSPTPPLYRGGVGS
jgi:hypothetical protein